MSNKYSLRLRKFILAARAILIAQYSLMIEYRAEIVLWALSGLLPLIMLALWQESQSSISSIFSRDNLSRYFISAFIVRQFTAVWVMVTFEEDTIEGRMAPYLLQPIAPFWRYYLSHIAEQISRIPIVILMLIILILFSPNLFWMPGLKDVVMGLIAIYLAFSVRFMLHWNFSMLCFWTERSSSVERLLMIPYLFLSGLLAPIDSFPAFIKSFALFTPFPYILYYPSKIIAGLEVNTLSVLMTLLFWLTLFTCTGRLLWHFGLKRYSAMGS